MKPLKLTALAFTATTLSGCLGMIPVSKGIEEGWDKLKDGANSLCKTEADGGTCTNKGGKAWDSALESITPKEQVVTNANNITDLNEKMAYINDKAKMDFSDIVAKNANCEKTGKTLVLAVNKEKTEFALKCQ